MPIKVLTKGVLQGCVCVCAPACLCVCACVCVVSRGESCRTSVCLKAIIPGAGAGEQLTGFADPL